MVILCRRACKGPPARPKRAARSVAASRRVIGSPPCRRHCPPRVRRPTILCYPVDRHPTRVPSLLQITKEAPDDMSISWRKDPIVEDFFGTPVADPYRWLEDPNS